MQFDLTKYQGHFLVFGMNTVNRQGIFKFGGKQRESKPAYGSDKQQDLLQYPVPLVRHQKSGKNANDDYKNIASTGVVIIADGALDHTVILRPCREKNQQEGKQNSAKADKISQRFVRNKQVIMIFLASVGWG